MDFVAFCRGHGLLIDSPPPLGCWVRYPTEDHPRKKNGAAKYLGDIGWVQNHAMSTEVATWRPDADAPQVDRQQIANRAAEFERRMRDGWLRAAKRAQQLIAESKPDEHPYLKIKGLRDSLGLCHGDALVVPMRNWRTNEIQGAQVIRWLPDERKYEKKMLPGMRAKGAVFRLGNASRRTWLVEGYATGLSVHAALTLMRLPDAVLVCFSAGNLVYVAGEMGTKECAVFADNDESGAGEKAALDSGRPYCMAPVVGWDANDMHAKRGVYEVAALMQRLVVPKGQPP